MPHFVTIFVRSIHFLVMKYIISRHILLQFSLIITVTGNFYYLRNVEACGIIVSLFLFMYSEDFHQ